MDRTLIEKTAPAALGAAAYLAFHDLFGTKVSLSALFSIPIAAFSLALAAIACFQAAGRGRSVRRRRGDARAKRVRRLSGGLLGRSSALVVVSGFLISFAAGSWDRRAAVRSHSGLPLSDIGVVEAVLTEDPRRMGPNRWTAAGRLRSATAVMPEGSGVATVGARGRVRIYGSGDPRDLGAGRTAFLRGRLDRPGGTGGTYVFSSESYVPGPWVSMILSRRHALLEKTGKKLLLCRPDTASFLSALLLGRKTDSGSPVMMRIESAGCIHLLALSGFHVGLIAMTIHRLLKPAGPAVSSVASALAATAYLFLSGLRPSLVRAVAMFCFWAFDRARGIRVAPLNYLGAAFFLQCVFFPGCADSPAFRLSYAALLGLLTAGTSVANFLRRLRLGRLSGILAAGVGAHASTLPFVLSFFGSWRPIGMAAAPVLTPLVAGSMAVGAALLALPAESAFFRAAVSGADFLVSAVCAAARPFSGFPEVSLPILAAWPAALCGVILPLLFPGRTRNAVPCWTEPRFPGLDPRIPGSEGSRPEKALGAELPHQPRRQGEDPAAPGRRRRRESLGNRSGPGRHERIAPGRGSGSDGLRDRSGVLRLAGRVPRAPGPGARPGRRHEDMAGPMGKGEAGQGPREPAVQRGFGDHRGVHRDAEDG